MKKKILGLILTAVMVVPCFSGVFAVNATTLLDRLENISYDIARMKEEYNSIITTYPEVIDALSQTNKEAVKNLANNLMADNIKETVNSVKAELQTISLPEATEVLDAINSLENEAKELINDNKDIVNELKSGYQDLTIEEAKQIIEKVKDITVSLGADIDTTSTYNEMMSLVTDTHTMLLAVNVKLENIIANNLDSFKEVASIQLMKDLFYAVKSKNIDQVIDVLVDAINSTSNSVELKNELKSLKQDAVAIKNKVKEAASLDEQEILMFSDTQIASIAAKIKDIQNDYVAFAKILINQYSKDYVDVVIGLAYDVSVDKMVSKANRAIDYFVQYKTTLKNMLYDLKEGKIDTTKLPVNVPKDLLQKAGLMVSLGFVDISDLNKTYLLSTFSDEIDMLMDYAAEQVILYVNNIDKTLKSEIKSELGSSSSANVIQTNVKQMVVDRFNTLDSIIALKDRAEKEIIGNRANIKSKLEKAMGYVYNVYNVNIFNSIKNVISLEAQKDNKDYELIAESNCIVTDKFMKTSDFVAAIGIPSSKNEVASFLNLNGSAIKTGATLDIKLSDKASASYSFVVLGDVYADGVIDARDYMAIKNQIMGKDTLSQTSEYAADAYRDDQIDARDYMAIKNQIMEKDTITL